MEIKLNMTIPPEGPAATPKRLGLGMIIAAWLLLLALATVFFGDWLDHQNNPNRQVQGRILEDGVREVVLKRNRGGHYVATGRINGQPVEFLLDTGATTVSIPTFVARRLGLSAGRPMRATTANGVITTYATRLDTVQIGEITVRNVSGSINPGMPDDGILLGMSFLKQLEFTQRGATLTLRQYPNQG